jgi:serine/threonine-protein kinase
MRLSLNGYGLRHLPEHLCALGRLVEAVALVTGPDFLAARLESDGNADGARRQLEAVAQACRLAGEEALAARVDDRLRELAAAPDRPLVEMALQGERLVARWRDGSVATWDAASARLLDDDGTPSVPAEDRPALDLEQAVRLQALFKEAMIAAGGDPMEELRAEQRWLEVTRRHVPGALAALRLAERRGHAIAFLEAARDVLPDDGELVVGLAEALVQERQWSRFHAVLDRAQQVPLSDRARLGLAELRKQELMDYARSLPRHIPAEEFAEVRSRLNVLERRFRREPEFALLRCRYLGATIARALGRRGEAPPDPRWLRRVGAEYRRERALIRGGAEYRRLPQALAQALQWADEQAGPLARGEDLPPDLDPPTWRSPDHGGRAVVLAEDDRPGLTGGPTGPITTTVDIELPPAITIGGDAPTPSGRPGDADVLPPRAPWPHHIDRYELLQELGRGDSGVVYKARDQELARLVALKMLLLGAYASAADRGRLLAEARAAARLDHPDIVPLYDVGEYQGQPFFAMKFVEGSSLDRKLAGSPLPPREGAKLIATLAEAVQYAHEHGLLHRDLKPSNILLTQDGRPLVADFGLVARAEDQGSLTRSGAIVGTPSYMAPEQARDEGHRVDARTDLWALGAILYECLTGRPPFRGYSALDTMMQVLHRDPAPPRLLNPNVDPDLEAICLKCLEKDPANRYDTAAALAADLDLWLEGRRPKARPAGPLARALRRVGRLTAAPRRHTAVALCVVLVLAVLAALAALGLLVLLRQ